MTKAKKEAKDHSKDYRDRQKEKAAKLGIEKVTIDMASSVKAGMAAAMKRNGITSVQEAWQNLGLYLKRASPEEQDRMLKPDSSGFVVTEELSRQFDELSRAEIVADPGDEILNPIESCELWARNGSAQYTQVTNPFKFHEVVEGCPREASG